MTTPARRPAPGWRQEPHRLLFPLGALLGLLAVLPFALRGAGGGSLALFHSAAQLQGFLTCFALGFLFTFLPRRTGTDPPAGWVVLACAALAAGSAACAWFHAALASYLCWLALATLALAFTLRRMVGRARAGLPPAFAWLPVSLAAGLCGALLAALAPLLGSASAPGAWVVGRGLLTQGLLAGLVVGVGGVLLPVITRGEVQAAGERGGAQHRALGHLAAAVLFQASFALEPWAGEQAGFGLRAAVAAAALVLSAGIHRWPALPGLHRRLVWLGAWMVPAGFALGALSPRLHGAALHVLFVGGYAQLALALAVPVVLGGSPRAAALAGSPPALRATALLLAGAFAARVAAALDLTRVAAWLAVAGAAFAGALAAWTALVLPSLSGSPPAR
ncbi:MAG: NnrS family protein [Deltaproteobacteria bacterium]|nr:NnrS family protein [Deltaproteobacteria bacterium]